MNKSFVLTLLLIFSSFFAFAVNVTVGASGTNYITDGTNDEVEIQQAINFVNVNGGGTVILSDGTYNIQTTRIVAKSDVILRGSSRDGTILSSPRTYDYIVFNTAEIRRFQLKNLTINPQNAYRASGVRFELVSQVLVENVKFINVTCDGWMLTLGIDGNDAGTKDIFSRDNGVRNCLFDGHSGSLEMLLLFNSKNTVVENCIFQNKSGTCPTLGGQPGLGLWQKTDSISIKNCQFTNIAGYETIYYSNTSNNTLIEGCTFTNSGGIRGANESDWGTFGVAHATNLTIRNCTLTGGANSLTKAAIHLGAIYNVLIKNCTISYYEEGIIFHKGYFTLNDLCKNFAVVNTNIFNCNPQSDVYNLHAGAYFQTIGGSMNGYFVCGSISDNQATPTQRQPVSFYIYVIPHVTTYFSDLYFLGTTISSYNGHQKFRYLNDAAQGSPFVVEDCTGCSPPTYCSSCPNISDADAVAWINSYSPTTAAIIQNLMNYQTISPVLPIELLDFHGVSEKNGNRLTWLLGDAKTVKNIELLRSLNGVDFTPLSILSKNEQLFLDTEFFSKMYYQLKINDLAGKFNFSKIIALENSEILRGVKIYPNPTTGDISLNFESDSQGEVTFKVVNLLGSVVFEKRVVVEKGSVTMPLSLSKVVDGIYSLMIQNKNQQLIERIIVAKK